MADARGADMHRNADTESRRFAGAGLDTSEGRSFVRDRLALEGKMISLLGGIFWVAVTALDAGLGIMGVVDRLKWRPSIFHLVGTALMAALWLAARRRDWSIRALGVLDGLALVLGCWCWALMMGGSGQMLAAALLAGMVTVTVRAVVVPSSATRTFWLSLMALVPMVPVSFLLGAPAAFAEHPFPPELVTVLVVVTTALWVAVAVAVATMISRVIYGLRRRVKEANELGQYTLEKRIGVGGMGEVWRAHHRLLIRPAAIKLIRRHALGSSPGDPERLHRRFEREARATAALQSPHTVQLYDFGTSDDGTLYYVMELLEGFNADELVGRFGPVPAERAVHILQQVCCSLADAHRNGLVHRDIKPANVFLSRSGMVYDFVKVLDFGLVKLDRPRDPQDTLHLSRTGIAPGTPAFIAPELVLGHRVDHRADIYSFGCVAYWLLTGRLVFEGETAIKVMLDHAHTPPPQPSTRVELPIPPDLERLILDCLEKDPARRPASAEELSNRLAACALETQWTTERAERWWGAHAPDLTWARPVADLLLSREAQPAGMLRPQTRPRS